MLVSVSTGRWGSDTDSGVRGKRLDIGTPGNITDGVVVIDVSEELRLGVTPRKGDLCCCKRDA